MQKKRQKKLLALMTALTISGELISVHTPTYAAGEHSGIQERSPDVSFKFGKEFKDRTKAEEWGRKYFADWHKKLSIVEQKSLTNYTTEKGYQINKYLRHNEGEVGKNDLLDREVKNIDSAIKKAKTTEAIKVYRRVGENAFGIEADSLRDKNTINREKYQEFAGEFINTERKEHGYLSTTLVRELSKETKIKSPEIALMPIILELKIPKGTNAAYINDLSHKPWEQELLIDRGSSFKIHGMSIIVEDGRERLKVTADLVKK